MHMKVEDIKTNEPKSGSNLEFLVASTAKVIQTQARKISHYLLLVRLRLIARKDRAN